MSETNSEKLSRLKRMRADLQKERDDDPTSEMVRNFQNRVEIEIDDIEHHRMDDDGGCQWQFDILDYEAVE